MTYLVMARKWRPQKFDEVIGQEHVTQTIKNAVKTGRIHHAYLFTGTRGVGKTTSARILAKCLNCEQGPTYEPCGVCNHCQNITSGNHIDVQEIDGASNRGIDEIRNLRENVRYAPNIGRYKIYIIDEVHMLTTEAFNALLKTLEEPPPHVVFIFATTEVHKIPATILSRCQKFDFRRISQKEIQERLQMIIDKENTKIEKEALYLIAKKADGSLRDAQSLLDQIISFSSDSITAKDVQTILGIVDQELYFKVTEAILKKDVLAGLNIIDEIFVNGYDLHEFSMGMLDHFRNLLILKTQVDNQKLVNISPHFYSQYIETAKQFSFTDILRFIEICLKIEADTKKNVHSRSLLELRLAAMINLESSTDLSAILEYLGKMPDNVHFNVPQAESFAEPRPAYQSETPKIVPLAKDTVTEDNEVTLDADKLWQQLHEIVNEKRKIVSAPLSCVKAYSINNHILELTFEPESDVHCQYLKQPENRNFLVSEIKSLTGDKITHIEFIANAPTVNPLNENKASQTPEEQQSPKPAAQKVRLSGAVLEKNPEIKTVIDLFDGEIVT